MTTPKPPPFVPVQKRVYRVFCDESGHRGHHYMVIGGVVIHHGAIDEVATAFRSVRSKHNMIREFKWGKVSRSRMAAYQDFVGVFDAFRKVMHYKSIVVDMTQVDLAKYHNGDPEIGFYKFYWLLLNFKFGLQYLREPWDIACITLDNRSSSYSLDDLKTILNRNLYAKRGLIDPVHSVEALCSKKSDFLQIADVMTGAIGYHCNDHDKATNASPARTDLASHIAKLGGVGRLSDETAWAAQQFEIWRWQPKK